MESRHQRLPGRTTSAKAGGRAANPSTIIPVRMSSSAANTPVPSRPGSSTMQSSKTPSAQARAALVWLSTA
jgi:hypothetical protein